jgi:hypothetical protein
MKLILSALLLCISTLVFGQQQVTTGNSTANSPIVSQYGDSFKSLGGSVLSGKTNGNNKAHSTVKERKAAKFLIIFK